MKLLYGKPIAERILGKLKNDVASHLQKPGLAVILAGEDEASKIYVSLKEKAAREIGMNFFRHDFPENVSEAEILNLISKLNTDPEVHGVVVQLPLPKGLTGGKIISKINHKKDVDGFHCKNIECFIGGKERIKPVFPSAIMFLVESSGKDIQNKKAVVIANSNEFGKVMVAALAQKGALAEYFLSGDMSPNLAKIMDADIVVSAVGSRGLISGKILKDGVIVVDGGIEKENGKVVGDVDFDSTKGKNGFIAPVPGGVGPVTIACLLENTYLAFKAQQK